jgi:ubiquinone/menaquinone biosynthesis C-methylase UbiE
MTTATEIDPAKVEEQVMKLLGFMSGALVSFSVALGDRLGLYRSMAGAGPLTSGEVADRAGLHERWVREWLSQQAAAGFIDYADGRFELSPETAVVLADESTPASGIGFVAALPSLVPIFDDLPECFRTGMGRKYDAHGAAMAAAMERTSAPTTPIFTDVAIPSLDGVVPKLEAGARVADIGCGAGGRLIALAARYPNSTFRGYDISEHALALARENAAKAGVTNLTFHNPDHDPLPPDASFDLVTFGDVVHDLAHPEMVLGAVRKALKPDGTMLVIDVAAGETLEDNLANPMAPLFFGSSMMICLSSSMSEEGGAGIGTLGLSTARLQSMTEAAGFTRFRTTDVEDVMNAYYEVRP